MPTATKPPGALQHYSTVKVQDGCDGSYSSSLVATSNFNKGDTIAPLQGFASASCPSYLTLQIEEALHVDLGSDFVYMNHSCSPNVIIDLRQRAYVACKDIRENDELYFFYPSTEWSMDRPFTCWCRSEQCLKHISGAKDLDQATLEKFFVNEHIWRLKRSQKH